MKLFKPVASIGVAAILGFSSATGVYGQEEEFSAQQSQSEQKSTEAQTQQSQESQTEAQQSEAEKSEAERQAALQEEQEKQRQAAAEQEKSVVTEKSTPSAQSEAVQPSSRPAGQYRAAAKDLKVDEQELKKTVGKVNKASNLIGMKVKNRDNEDLGSIEDLAIDFESGKVSYAVIGVGGFLGIGEKYVGIPLEALTPTPGEDHLLLDASKQAMDQAKGFSRKNWPDLDVVTWDTAAGLARSPAEGAETFEGKVTRIDQDKGTIMVEGEDESREFKMEDKRKFGRGDRGEAGAKSLTDLEVGTKVTVHYQKQGDDQFVAKKVMSQDEKSDSDKERKSDE
jgi:sporulation protein YlmC with PRC-barrel domain